VENIVVNPSEIEFFSSPKQYKEQLLSLISSARKRIFITALYLQDDGAGKDVLHALYQAKANFPDLVVNVFVDFNRGQRGLIGEKESQGNRALYLKLAEEYAQKINIYGVAVKRKEVFGVLHLKGMVFDDKLFYTGASINDIYCQQNERYRLDRYCSIQSASLTNSFCDYLESTFIESELAPLLNQENLPDQVQQKQLLTDLKTKLKKSKYLVQPQSAQDSQSGMVKNSILIKQLVVFGIRGNYLNRI
jgi:CDP-diacylglycerol--serine O-phosphatidyltransferase